MMFCQNFACAISNTHRHKLRILTCNIGKKSFYLTTCACQFGIHRYTRSPFGAILAGDMFQRKIDEIFKELPNVSGIAYDNLTVGYGDDSTDHDNTKQNTQNM